MQRETTAEVQNRRLVEDELSEVADAIAVAVSRRDELIRAITWKSSREVGQIANLSHTRVQQIAKDTAQPEGVMRRAARIVMGDAR